MSQPTSRSVSRKLSRLSEQEEAGLVKDGFGSLFALRLVAYEKDGAPLVDSVLALHTETGRRPRRPEDEANAARARRRARGFHAATEGMTVPSRRRMRLPAVLWSWTAIWAIAVLFVPAGM